MGMNKYSFMVFFFFFFFFFLAGGKVLLEDWGGGLSSLVDGGNQARRKVSTRSKVSMLGRRCVVQSDAIFVSLNV